MRRVVFAAVLYASLCGSALLAQAGSYSDSQTTDTDKKAFTEAYDKAFRTAFRVKGVNQCVASARSASAAGYDITPTCVCVAETLLATKSITELEQLGSADANHEEIKAVTAQCLKTDPPLQVGAIEASRSSQD